MNMPPLKGSEGEGEGEKKKKAVFYRLEEEN
jgi:hypothetical protein